MNRASQTLATGMLTAVLLSGGAAAADQQTPAGPHAWSDCPRVTWCMWDGDNAVGDIYSDSNEPKYNPDLTEYGWNDRANSVVNNSTRNICVYWDKNYGGNYVRIAAGGKVNLPVSWRNRVSSYRQLPSGVSSCVYD
ncbi:peptidase inhibitor family I36 protein [Streptomyces sp. NPDC059070]|uniref:peptidase inhibitor family I36 protein n=1 Tax=Streptomyces sp. NPDC059070 TaxID=3346713 RepID=UPI003692C0D4